MWRIVGKIVEALVVATCLPIYAVAAPAIFVHEFFLQRRRVRLNQEITHWPVPDVRNDLLVVDISRADEGLVGVRHRRWNVLHRHHTRAPIPDYSPEVHFISIARFWVPVPLFSSSKPPRRVAH